MCTISSGAVEKAAGKQLKSLYPTSSAWDAYPDMDAAPQAPATPTPPPTSDIATFRQEAPQQPAPPPPSPMQIASTPEEILNPSIVPISPTESIAPGSEAASITKPKKTTRTASTPSSRRSTSSKLGATGVGGTGSTGLNIPT